MTRPRRDGDVAAPHLHIDEGRVCALCVELRQAHHAKHLPVHTRWIETGPCSPASTANAATCNAGEGTPKQECERRAPTWLDTALMAADRGSVIPLHSLQQQAQRRRLSWR